MSQHNTRITLLTITIFFCCISFVPGRAAQDIDPNVDTVKLKAIVNRAVEFMDRNLADEAMKRWDSALAMRPGYVLYKYERAICLVMAERYQEAIDSIKIIYQDSLLYDRGYQLIGNSYDYLGDSATSMMYYTSGLRRYPKSGRLHYEMGAAAFIGGRLDSALTWWVRGTQSEPTFATNYYWIAKSSAKSANRIWTILFGEAFMNIEPGTERTKEIGRIVFDAWNASMRLGDPDDPINFCSDELLNEPSPFGPNVMNFPTAFEFTIAQSSQHYIPKIGVRTKLTVAELVDVRKRFIDGWIGAGYFTKYPNDVFTWHEKLKKNGWLNEYLWWLHGFGDIQQMQKYFSENEARYDTFFGWLMQNPFRADKPLCLGLHCSK